jgi:hypothetical protein
MGTSSPNGDIEKKMMILTLTVLAVFVIIVLLNIGKDRGCSGSCCQGRKPCDCKDKE